VAAAPVRVSAALQCFQLIIDKKTPYDRRVISFYVEPDDSPWGRPLRILAACE